MGAVSYDLELPMPSRSPTLQGFRAAFRRPWFTLAEIAWRWTVGAVAGTLFLFAFFEFLDTLPVTARDPALLKTRHPLLVGRAIAHIFRGSLNRAVFAALLAALALSVLWIIAASIGRLATVRALLDYFRSDVDGVPSDLPTQSSIRPLIFLNALRVAALLAATLAFAGAAILASFISSDAHPRPGLVVILFLPLAGLIAMAWSALNWLLGLAAIFAVRNGLDALNSLSAAVTVVRERLGPVCAVGMWTGMAHLVAFSVASSALSLPLAFARVAPVRPVIVITLLVTLTYFAGVDWLYIARLAAYLYIAEMPEALATAPSLPVFPPAGGQAEPSAPLETAVDRDELILGDLPSFTPAT
jgi:hypothetical protein